MLYPIFFWISYIIIIIIGTEIFAYLWHRFIAHNHEISGISDTHEIHHMEDIFDGDDDFIWLLFLIIISEIIIGIGVMFNIISGIIVVVTIIIAVITFYWNWWIHKAYHNDKHWLNSYKWFQQEKHRHYIHHYNPNFNYGIASHFSDKIFGTWIETIPN